MLLGQGIDFRLVNSEESIANLCAEAIVRSTSKHSIQAHLAGHKSSSWASKSKAVDSTWRTVHNLARTNNVRLART